ncbi:MAG: aminodeoxychorismate/anthranilate synthase component II, partial [Bacteroidales bacterium]|nr:aminodeoxychorismate/anthranilate synthase component II [Bacteroidales bacterium]
FGGTLVNLSEVFHGVQTPVHVVALPVPGSDVREVDYIFKGLHADLLVGRYNSWVVDADNQPECLEITALSNEGQVMALRHREYDIRGIQFHPESVLTPDGRRMIQNWLLHRG